MENGYRLIDANALRCEIDGCSFESGYDCGKVLIMIAEAPTVDAVEVVRCRHCRCWDKAVVNKKGFLICPASGMEIMADDFCSYGERREGE